MGGDEEWQALCRDERAARCQVVEGQHEARYAAFDLFADLAREQVMSEDGALEAYRVLDEIVAKPDLSPLDPSAGR